MRDISVSEHIVNILPLLLLHLLSLLGRQSLDKVHIILVNLIDLTVVMAIIIFRCDTIFLILLIISVLIGHVLLPKVVRKVNLSVKPVSHNEILGVIHHVPLILGDIVEVVACLGLERAHLVPVVALEDLVHGLAAMLAVIL